MPFFHLFLNTGVVTEMTGRAEAVAGAEIEKTGNKRNNLEPSLLSRQCSKRSCIVTHGTPCSA